MAVVAMPRPEGQKGFSPSRRTWRLQARPDLTREVWDAGLGSGTSMWIERIAETKLVCPTMATTGP